MELAKMILVLTVFLTESTHAIVIMSQYEIKQLCVNNQHYGTVTASYGDVLSAAICGAKCKKVGCKTFTYDRVTGRCALNTNKLSSPYSCGNDVDYGAEVWCCLLLYILICSWYNTYNMYYSSYAHDQDTKQS